jgi:hypothetical protein
MRDQKTTGQHTPAEFIPNVHLNNCAKRGSYQQNLFANLCITSRQNLQAVDVLAIFTATSMLGTRGGPAASYFGALAPHAARALTPSPRFALRYSPLPARRARCAPPRAIVAANGSSAARQDVPS